MENLKIPNHVAIIMDGNGRWATKRNLPRSKGHDAGYKNLRKLSEYILSKGIKVLSVYAFSTENFKRSKEEVDHLMNLFVKSFNKERKYFLDKDIKIVFSGTKKNLREDVIKAMIDTEKITKDCKSGIFNICLNYGGRQEIIDAALKIKELDVCEITEEEFKNYLYQDLPDIDLVIRTSGEYRISNFMLWQISYAEFYFTDTLFPDFNELEFDKALISYTKRDRRFGGLNEKK